MIYQDHIHAARSFLPAEDLLSRSNLGMAGAEMLWGASVHVINAIKHLSGTRHSGNNRDRELIVEYLSDQYGNGDLPRGFEAISLLHNHFYTGRLSDEELSGYLATGIDFLNRMLELAERESA